MAPEGDAHGTGPPLGRRRRRHLSPIEGHIIAASAEFVGTFLFLYMGYAGHLMSVDQAPAPGPNGKFSNQTVVFIALSYALSLLVNVWAFYRISGGLFNPAVTLGLCLSGHVGVLRAALLIPTQLLAAISAAGLVKAMFPVDITSASTILAPGTSTASGLFAEMFFTAQLVFVVFMLAEEKSRDTFLAPVGIGLALFATMIPGVYYTGGSLNPARSLGPAVAGRQFPGYHWIYWLGPALGAVVAAGYYHFVKFFHYEDVNPGQDEAAKGEQV